MTLNADFKVKFAVFRFVSWMRGLIVSRTCLYVVRALLPETHNWTVDDGRGLYRHNQPHWQHARKQTSHGTQQPRHWEEIKPRVHYHSCIGLNASTTAAARRSPEIAVVAVLDTDHLTLSAQQERPFQAWELLFPAFNNQRHISSTFLR